jgi:hypothetical protein
LCLCGENQTKILPEDFSGPSDSLTENSEVILVILCESFVLFVALWWDNYGMDNSTIKRTTMTQEFWDRFYEKFSMRSIGWNLEIPW